MDKERETEKVVEGTKSIKESILWPDEAKERPLEITRKAQEDRAMSTDLREPGGRVPRASMPRKEVAGGGMNHPT